MKLFSILALFSLINSALAFESPQALQNAFMSAMRANDVDGLAACYTADALNFTPDVMMGIGPDSVHASWGSFFKSYRVIAAELTHDQMEVSGDLAAAWGLFKLTVEPVGGGEPFDIQGRFMDVARNINGQWLYIADHASVPLPAEEE